MEVSGLRSSWETFATNSRRLRSMSASFSDIVLKAEASAPTSGEALSCCTRREKSPPAIASAAAVSVRRGFITRRRYSERISVASRNTPSAIPATGRMNSHTLPSTCWAGVRISTAPSTCSLRT